MHDIRYPVKVINDVPVITPPDEIDLTTADQSYAWPSFKRPPMGIRQSWWT